MNVEVKYTYQDLLTAPNDRHRYEIFEGELIMTPAPSRAHQQAHSNLFRIIANYVAEGKLGELYSAPFDVYFDEETVVEPDILFVSKDRLYIIDEQKVNGAPDLVVEIVSASTEKHDRGFKFKRYAEEGIKEYWIVDPTSKVLEVYTLGQKGFERFGKYAGSEEVRSTIFPDLRFQAEDVWK